MPVNHPRRTLAALVAVALCAATASCSGLDSNRSDAQQTATSAGTPAKTGGRLVVGVEADANGLDPTRNAWDQVGIQIANAVFDPLAAFDADGRPQPYLAESFTPNADFTSWRIKVRPGVVFHDGTPLNAAAALVFIDKVRASAITGPPAQNISDVRPVDDLTIELTMKRPWASFPALLAGQGGYIVAPDQLNDAHDKDGRSHPIGTGPFMLRSWTQDVRYELVRNPRYWRPGLPYLDSVEFAVESRGADRIDRMRRGTIDATAVSRFDDIKAVEMALARPESGLISENDTSDAEKDAVVFNLTKPPLDDLRIRQAIASATDLDALAAANGWPRDRAAQGPISPASPYFAHQDYPRPDIERARALVQEYLADPRVKRTTRDVSFSLNAAEFDARWVQALVAQWARAGITARINLVPVIQMTRLVVLGVYEASMFRYFAAQDPDVLWHFFVSDTINDSPISLNFTRIRNDELTQAMNDGRATPDPERRKQAYARMQAVFARELPYVWLNRQEWRMVTTTKVRNARNVTLPDGRPALPYLAGTYRLTETWIDD